MATTIAEILTEAPQFIRVLEDLVNLAVAADKQLSGKSGLGILTALPALATQAQAVEADIVKAYGDAKALGAAQATTPPTGAGTA